MMIPKTGLFLLVTVMPFVENRGSIPFGVAMGIHPVIIILSAIVINSLLFFPIYYGLKILYERFFSEFRIVKMFVNRIRTKGQPYVEKYGFVGLTLFVGIPMPMTGVYSGTLLGWLLNMEWKKTLLAIVGGVLISTAIIFFASYGILRAFAIF